MVSINKNIALFNTFCGYYILIVIELFFIAYGIVILNIDFIGYIIYIWLKYVHFMSNSEVFLFDNRIYRL